MSDFIETKGHNGVKFFCTKSQWDSHVVADLTGHPIMKNNIPAIIETLTSPDYIYESHDSDPPLDYREVYSKEVKTASYYSKVPYTRVVVSVLGGSGEIVTAFPGVSPTQGTKGEAIYIAPDKR